MKNIFRKNQVIITALAIMIAVAGYLNFTKDNNNNALVAEDFGDGSIETSGTDTLTSSDAIDEQVGTLDISDTDNKLLKEAEEDNAKTKDSSKKTNKTADIDVLDTGELASTGESGDEPGDAVLVNNSIGSGILSSAKITREQTRAKNKEMLMEIVNNSNISEKQKQDAINDIIEMTAITEKENAAETLLLAKGFENVVVSIVEGKADIVVNASQVTDEKAAQIQDIVKRKTGLKAENIVITPVEVTKDE